MTISTNTDSALIALDVMRQVKREFPAAHMTSGLSNVSFGLPVRSLVNRTYLTLAMSAGLDSAILDPLDRDLQASSSPPAGLGQDRRCLGTPRLPRRPLGSRLRAGQAPPRRRLIRPDPIRARRTTMTAELVNAIAGDGRGCRPHRHGADRRRTPLSASSMPASRAWPSSATLRGR
jgi:hypothetical protein